MQPTTPALVRTSRTALLARQPRLDPAELAPLLFVETVVACDAADRRYRATIETETAQLFVRGKLAPVDIDPLDLATPRVSGLSHVDLVRLADLSDRARASVRRLREDANARIAPLLDERARETLVAAKRERNVAFAGAVHGELVPLGKRVERLSDTVDALATLADGWY